MNFSKIRAISFPAFATRRLPDAGVNALTIRPGFAARIYV